MAKPVAGDIVVLPFPQSNLSLGKRRPALVLVDLPGDDLILCAITSQLQRLGPSILLQSNDFSSGRLNIDSYIRPHRLFTIEHSVIAYVAGTLKIVKLNAVLDATAQLFQKT